jgi:hypothetical protein
MKKFNFTDDFEAIYLRETGLRQLKITTEHELILASPETKKVLRYTAGYHWNNGANYWLNMGIGYDDILGMMYIYALYYIGKYHGTDEYSYKNMMRFMGQRLKYYGECFERKFSLSESVSEPSALTDYMQVASELESYTSDNKTSPRTPKTSKEELNFLKLKLSQNINDYKDLLAYYAITKHVSSDLRKKAKKYCKLYGINYTEIAKDKYLGKGFDLHYVLD